jgi:hypothetical protein
MAMRLDREQILAFLRQHKALFASQYSVSKIGLFGSYARNEQTEGSDIDIIIEMPADTEYIFDKRMALKGFLAQHFQRPVDVCHERALHPAFRPLVIQKTVFA